MANTKKLVIIWGGFWGLRTFYNLASNKKLEITLIDKRESSSMKPVMPEVAFEGKDINTTSFDLKKVIESKWHKYINWEVEKIVPTKNKINLKDSTTVEYDYLVIAAWARKAFENTKGLEENWFSMCDDKHAPLLWEKLKNFKEGKILIGADKSVWGEATSMKWEAPCEWPIWEAMYMIDHYFRKQGIRDKVEITAFAPGAVFRWDAPNLHESRGIKLLMEHVIKEIKKDSVVFQNWEKVKSDLTIVIPKYEWQKFLIDSKLSDDKGFLVTDDSFRHIKYSNIFGCGDLNAKTMPKLWHLAVMQADIVSSQLRNELGENVKVKAYDPEILCIMNMGGTEASIFHTKTAFWGTRHMVWQWAWQGLVKRQFDFYNIVTKGKMPPHFWEIIFKKLIWIFGKGNK